MKIINKKVIYFNGRFLSQTTTGVQRYAQELIKAIDIEIDRNFQDYKDYSFIILTPRNTIEILDLKHIKIKKVGYCKGHIWEQFELPFYSFNEFLINLCNIAPILKKNQVLTIHDAAIYSNKNAYSSIYIAWYRFIYSVLRRTLKKIITVSEFSKKELSTYSKIPKEKLSVIYEGKEHILNFKNDESIMEKHKLRTGSYILAVSSLNPNKNFKSIVEALELLPDSEFEVVIAGGMHDKVFADSNISFSGRIKHVGYVSNDELKTLYINAGCFIYPSFYEGFGLPPIEAMACGCPVIVSNTASLPEICGDAAVYCDPYSISDIAKKINMVMSNKDLRNSLRKKGIKRSGKFKWEQAAKESFNVFKGVGL